MPLILFLTVVYTALFLLPLASLIAMVEGWKVALREDVYGKIKIMFVTVAGVGLLGSATVYGDPVRGVAVIGGVLFVVLLIAMFILPLVYAITKNLRLSIFILVIPTSLLLIGLAIWAIVSVQLTLIDFLSYVLGTLLVSTATAGLGLLPWLMLRLENPCKSVTIAMLLVWVSMGVAGWVYFATESDRVDAFTGIEREIARNEIDENWRFELDLGTFRWRVVDVNTTGDVSRFENSPAYYVRMESYLWMRFPINVLHIYVDDQGERRTEWERTWWEKWVP